MDGQIDGEATMERSHTERRRSGAATGGPRTAAPSTAAAAARTVGSAGVAHALRPVHRRPRPAPPPLAGADT